MVRPAVLAYAAVAGGSGGWQRARGARADRPSIRVAMVNRPIDLFAPGEMTRIAEGRVKTDERAIDVADGSTTGSGK